jgi:branched-chain amino acid transport system substrate-binding protein
MLLPALLLAACGSSGGSTTGGTTPSGSQATGGSFKVVLLTDISGVGAPNSKPGVSGVQAAIKKINDSGGVGGKKLDLTVYDAQSSADAALTAAQKAIADKPLGIIMFSTSAEIAKVTPVVEGAKIPFFSGGIPDSSLYPPKATDFSVGMSAAQAGYALATFGMGKTGGSFKGAVVDIAAINSPYVDVIIKKVTQLVTDGGGKIARTERYDYGIASFAAQAGNIARDKPTVVFAMGAQNDTIVVSKALTSAGVSATQIGIESGSGPAVVDALKNAKFWGLTTSVYPGDNPAFLAAADAAGVKDGILGSTYSNSGWVAAYLVTAGLGKCGADCDSTKLSAALEQVTGYTIPGGVYYGPINLSSTNHIAASVVKFHNFDPATGKYTDSDPVDVTGK